jgi:catechol 2,3-dioxygenase-like lactoylglutathione lyase family enzyme
MSGSRTVLSTSDRFARCPGSVRRKIMNTSQAVPESQARTLASGLIRPFQLAHIVIRTPSYRAMCEFYQAFLAADIGFEDELACFLRFDEEHHRVVLVNTPTLALPDGNSAGLAHFAFTYRSLDELLGNYRRLQTRGVHPCWCINHGFTTSIYYYDPDGNQVETQYDNMPAPAADAFMRSAYFKCNPIGVDFDPERLIERYLRGDAMSELIKQGSAPFPPDQMPVRPRRVLEYDFRGKDLPSTESSAPSSGVTAGE